MVSTEDRGEGHMPKDVKARRKNTTKRCDDIQHDDNHSYMLKL